MARRNDVKNVGLQLTEAEYEALAAFAKSAKRDKATIIRAALVACLPDFPADGWAKDERWQERGSFSFKDKNHVNVDESA